MDPLTMMVIAPMAMQAISGVVGGVMNIAAIGQLSHSMETQQALAEKQFVSSGLSDSVNTFTGGAVA